jgi:hypothetical protein
VFADAARRALSSFHGALPSPDCPVLVENFR